MFVIGIIIVGFVLIISCVAAGNEMCWWTLFYSDVWCDTHIFERLPFHDFNQDVEVFNGIWWFRKMIISLRTKTLVWNVVSSTIRLIFCIDVFENRTRSLRGEKLWSYAVENDVEKKARFDMYSMGFIEKFFLPLLSK